jgi:hypothetical protein
VGFLNELEKVEDDLNGKHGGRVDNKEALYSNRALSKSVCSMRW